MVEKVSAPWGVHRIHNVFAGPNVQAGLPDGRWVTAVASPYWGNRVQAAWWVLTGRAFALIWPEPGDLEDALTEHTPTGTGQ